MHVVSVIGWNYSKDFFGGINYRGDLQVGHGDYCLALPVRGLQPVPPKKNDSFSGFPDSLRVHISSTLHALQSAPDFPEIPAAAGTLKE